MIVSFKHRFVFVAIPKTGSQSVRSQLQGLLAPKDWEQCSFAQVKTFPIASLSSLGHGHITARQIQQVLPPGCFENFFSFAFVRNPYERFVSFTAFYLRALALDEKELVLRMKELIQNRELRRHILMRPQCEFVCDAQNTPMVSKIAYFENFEAENNILLRRFGATVETVPHENRSFHRSYTDYYDEDLQRSVYNYYAQDFEAFGYDKRL